MKWTSSWQKSFENVRYEGDMKQHATVMQTLVPGVIQKARHYLTRPIDIAYAITSGVERGDIQ